MIFLTTFNSPIHQPTNISFTNSSIPTSSKPINAQKEYKLSQKSTNNKKMIDSRIIPPKHRRQRRMFGRNVARMLWLPLLRSWLVFCDSDNLYFRHDHDPIQFDSELILTLFRPSVCLPPSTSLKS